jgi:hypothetical protein
LVALTALCTVSGRTSSLTGFIIAQTHSGLIFYALESGFILLSALLTVTPLNMVGL